MTSKQSGFIRKQVILSFLINALGNGLIAYFTNRGKDLESISMSQNYVNLIFDIGLTALILAWLISWSINAELKKAGLHGSSQARNSYQAWMGRSFKKPARYGWVLCLAIIPVFYGLSLLGMVLLPISHFSLWGYSIYKAAYTACLGALFAFIFAVSGFYLEANGK